jgi:cysteine desulfurase
VVKAELGQISDRMWFLLDLLSSLLLEAFGPGAARVNGPAEDGLRLPNTLSISIQGLSAAKLLEGLGERLAASAAAACHSGGACGSSVLAAMGVAPEWAAGTLRLSVGRHTTVDDVRAAAALIVEAAAAQGVAVKPREGAAA